MRTRDRFLTLVAALALLAGACAGGDAPDETGSTPDPDAAESAPTDVEDPGAPRIVPDEDADAPVDVAPAGTEPVYGGELSFVVEGESSTWDLPNAECATSCVNVFRLAADPLFVEDDQGRPQPFLLESAQADNDFRVWTLELRAGIRFQNGEAVDADALALDLEHKSVGLITGPVLGAIESIESDGDLTVTLTFSDPHSSLPSEMTTVVGFLMAPAFWSDSHDRGAGGPIGTGPFVFEEWSPGVRTTLVRNDDYWRTDAEGRSLPYVDSVVIRPVPGKSDREAIIQAGDASLAHVDDVETPSLWLEDWDGGLLTADIGQQTSYGMFNGDAAPFDLRDARLAVALCTDRPTFNQFINPASTTANGPFAPGSIGHLDDTGFPAYDLEAGTALVESLGGLSFEYLTTDDTSEGLAAELLVSMWSDCGIDATYAQRSQAEVITRALLGDYALVSWRLHGASNPAAEFIWWHSSTAEGLALNAGRIRDNGIDAGLEAMRATDDPEMQRAAAESIGEFFADGVYNLWYAWSEWWIISQPEIRGIGVLELPDGGLASPKTHGDVWLHQAWIEPS